MKMSSAQENRKKNSFVAQNPKFFRVIGEKEMTSKSKVFFRIDSNGSVRVALIKLPLVPVKWLREPKGK